MVVVLTSAALIINPITFPSASVMKVRVIKGWLGFLGNSKCSTPWEHRPAADQLQIELFAYLACTAIGTIIHSFITALHSRLFLEHQWELCLLRTCLRLFICIPALLQAFLGEKIGFGNKLHCPFNIWDLFYFWVVIFPLYPWVLFVLSFWNTQHFINAYCLVVSKAHWVL